ncbi:sterile alpha motif domain-containing protein 9-like [Scomber japonicus]|uniref:sterile alpha motif domain-containing protein 9-like n=1 Tax=Scomber japonicus TaxID=13676 RepID=UPI0023063DAF|nr:sterile alpha motif domain-containing protein 9-like [Scomber japonicus]
MANGLALSTARGGEVFVGSEIRDSLSLLDVLYANQFEGESIDPEDVEQTEETFYRGAPPEWLNFHISEKAESNGTGTSFIKREGYDTLRQQIQNKRRLPGISTVKLFHQPGCGGTTLAMQVLWDLRKTFRCAVLRGSTSDITNVATEVVHLFTAGSQGYQNTVLLLLNDEHIPENLQNSIVEKITEQNIVTRMPVVIFLTCVRKNAVLQSDHVVLRKVLSDTEKQKFNEKKEELSRRYRDKCGQFHGFNIMQTDFSQAYVDQACTVFSTVQRSNKPLKTQLATFLSLLNAYVPGSYLLESQCLDFLQHEDSIHGHLSLEDRMKPFSHLIITFQHDARSGKKVRMAHPMIAQRCTELMGDAGVTRSDTARNFMNCLCRDEVSPCLLGFVKEMLTKREIKVEENPVKGNEVKEDQERFSRLILDIQRKECKAQCASVLKVALKIFTQNPFFPQALARFYYIEIKDYNKAERWAIEAKERDPKNSFVADTLGQVYKNQLKTNEFSTKPREILKLAKKAIEAFKDEERLAENEYGADMAEDGNTRVSNIFNIFGQFGYLQVCNLMYDQLVSQNETWKRVLTNNVSMDSVLGLLGDKKLYRFNGLVSSLRDEVEKKCEFFDKYLTYSKPDMRKDDAPYISRDTSECFKKYVGDSTPKHLKEKWDDLFQRLKEKLSVTSAGVLSCLDRKYTESDLQEITTWWKEIYSSKDTQTSLTNYVLAQIMLNNLGEIFSSDVKSPTEFGQITPPSPQNAPELNMLALLLKWPIDSEDKCVFDLSQSIQHMYSSYEHTYKTQFRSRYLRPLFFIGKGQNLDRIVHRRVLENLFPAQKEAAVVQDVQDLNVYWGSEKIFQDPMIQKRLLQIEGRVRNYRLYAIFGSKEIEVKANLQNSLWKPRQVTFYLGFTIRGPVAFGIQTKIAETGLKQDTRDWTELKPEVNRVGDVQTYSLRSGAGHYKCSVSAVRWFCKGSVSFKYQFTSWDKHMEEPSCVDYIPAGPLLDIKVTAGKLEEVHLPHWICTDDIPTIMDNFRVLHVDTSGHCVEEVSEVTSSHVKILQPVFSPRGAMIRKKLGFPVKVFYDMLIFKTNKASLTLHVYLLPPDPDVQQVICFCHSNNRNHYKM